MLTKIQTKEIMTTRAAMEKYRTQYFVMIITDIIDRGQNDLGYVAYIADNRRELHQIPKYEYEGKRVGFLHGVAAEPYPQIGNVVYHD